MTKKGPPGVHGGLFGGRVDKKSHFSIIWSSWMVFNPFIWAAYRLLMLGYALLTSPTSFRFEISHRGSPGYQWGHFKGRIWPKISFSGRLVVLDGFQPLYQTVNQRLVIFDNIRIHSNTKFFIRIILLRASPGQFWGQFWTFPLSLKH